MTHILIALVLLAGTAFGVRGADKVGAQKADTTTVESGHFDINRSVLQVTPAMEQLKHLTDSLNAQGLVEAIFIHSTSSPDGPYNGNARLSKNRAKAYRDFLNPDGSIADSIFTVTYVAEEWDGLLDLIAKEWGTENAAPLAKAMASTADPVARERFLRKYYTGEKWTALARDILPRLRKATATIYYNHGFSASADTLGTAIEYTVPEVVEEVTPEPEPIDEPEPVAEPQPAAVVVKPVEPYVPHWYLKTNLPGWLMLWANIAGEIDFAEHWSVQLPFYYSGWNYFKSTLKFRTCAIVPEVRWWPRHTNDGFFMGPHLGIIWYNVAFDGAYRYQDRDGRNPALGGGVSLGYRLPLGNGPWKLEFSIGAGAYSLDYDVFHNYHNGLLVDRKKRAFFGIDNAAITLAYTFDKYKKGGVVK